MPHFYILGLGGWNRVGGFKYTLFDFFNPNLDEKGCFYQNWLGHMMWLERLIIFILTRGGVLEDVLGLEDVLEDTFWSPWPWPRSLKRLALASKLQVLENCPVLGSRTALVFEQLKFRFKKARTSQKICEHLFCFPHLEHRRRQGKKGRVPTQLKFHQWQKCDKKANCFFSFSFFLAFFAYNTA